MGIYNLAAEMGSKVELAPELAYPELQDEAEGLVEVHGKLQQGSASAGTGSGAASVASSGMRRRASSSPTDLVRAARKEEVQKTADNDVPAMPLGAGASGSSSSSSAAGPSLADALQKCG